MGNALPNRELDQASVGLFIIYICYVMAVQYKKFRLAGYIVIGILFHLMLYLINPWDTEDWTIGLVKDLTVSTLGVMLVLESGLLINRKLDVYLPWGQFWTLRIIVQLVTQILIVSMVLWSFKALVPGLFEEMLVFRQAIVLGVILSLLTTAVVTAESFFMQWNRMALEAAKYEQKASLAQLEFLKIQIDPHFLFNNFSTLTSLIEEDAQLAVEYVQQLSAIYRHILSGKQAHIVRLEDELEFIRSYLFLYRIRYQESLIADIDIPDEVMDKGVATASMQLLVENAIKHNSISKQNPLVIRIFVQDNSLVIINNINPIRKRVESTGIGLKNIAERYLLLGRKEITISNDGENFMVKLPLLERWR